MSIHYNFLLTSRGEPKIPHLLVLIHNERTNKFSWEYYKIHGNTVFKGQKPESSGQDVRYSLAASQFDLYGSSNNCFGTLTLIDKSIRTIITGDKATFDSFSGSIDDAVFTKTT